MAIIQGPGMGYKVPSLKKLAAPLVRVAAAPKVATPSPVKLSGSPYQTRYIPPMPNQMSPDALRQLGISGGALDVLSQQQQGELTPKSAAILAATQVRYTSSSTGTFAGGAITVNPRDVGKPIALHENIHAVASSLYGSAMAPPGFSQSLSPTQRRVQVENYLGGKTPWQLAAKTLREGNVIGALGYAGQGVFGTPDSEIYARMGQGGGQSILPSARRFYTDVFTPQALAYRPYNSQWGRRLLPREQPIVPRSIESLRPQ